MRWPVAKENIFIYVSSKTNDWLEVIKGEAHEHDGTIRVTSLENTEQPCYTLWVCFVTNERLPSYVGSKNISQLI